MRWAEGEKLRTTSRGCSRCLSAPAPPAPLNGTPEALISVVFYHQRCVAMTTAPCQARLICRRIVLGTRSTCSSTL